MPEATFTVLIREARYLHATSFLTKQDPYARIWTSSSTNAKLNTKVIKNGGKNAKWEETFTIVVADDKAESFFLEVMNKNDITFDKVIGRAKFACSDISVTPAETWMKIYSTTGADAGEVLIKAHRTGGSVIQGATFEITNPTLSHSTSHSTASVHLPPIITTPTSIPPVLPPVLPLGWTMMMDPRSNKAYYVNEVFRTTQWEFPTHPVTPSAPMRPEPTPTPTPTRPEYAYNPVQVEHTYNPVQSETPVNVQPRLTSVSVDPLPRHLQPIIPVPIDVQAVNAEYENAPVAIAYAMPDTDAHQPYQQEDQFSPQQQHFQHQSQQIDVSRQHRQSQSQPQTRHQSPSHSQRIDVSRQYYETQSQPQSQHHSPRIDVSRQQYQPQPQSQSQYPSPSESRQRVASFSLHTSPTNSQYQSQSQQRGQSFSLPTSFSDTQSQHQAQSQNQQQQQQHERYITQIQRGQSFNTSPSNAPLPPGWSKKTTPEGKIYYVNHISNTTTWDRPT